MKKTIISIAVCITIILIAFLALQKDNDKVFVQNGIKYALLVNGKKSNAFPAKGLYKVDVRCNNAHGKWNYDSWKLEIDDIKGKISCDLSFESIEKEYLNDYIIGLNGTTQGDAQIVNEKGYRYEGKNPNNYIWFNNELWRIIGAMDSESHGVSDTYLVKIMRDSSIGGIAWNNSSKNDWTNSSLHKLLNPVTGDANSGAYYKRVNSTDSGYCYSYGSTTTPQGAVCNYSEKGILSNYRNMIKETKWFSGSSYANVSTEEMYSKERSLTPTQGYIGLISASDYGYSVLSTSCARTTKLSSYGAGICAGESWMFGRGQISTLSTYNTNAYLYIGDIGQLLTTPVYNGYPIYPTLYLDSNVFIYDGNGSINDPYIIGM